MKIGAVIRKYRREKHLTQEEMAKWLGVSAPAVNKWENGNSYPDITLLPPIARLLGISLEELLSFREELSEKEIHHFIETLNEMLKQNQQDQFEEAYRLAKKKIEEFPSCYPLIVQSAIVLDANRLVQKRELPEGFEGYIEALYHRALDSSEESVKVMAADSLMGYYIRKEKYEEAEKYLDYYSPQNPEKKRKQAQLYYETGQNEKAYKSYEEMLYTDYQRAGASLHGIYLLALKEQKFEKAHRIAEKQTELAKLFEMGKYHELSPHLELAVIEKKEEELPGLMADMLEAVDELLACKNSELYEHMEFKEVDPAFCNEIRENLRIQFADEETFGFLKENPEWKKLIKKYTL